MSASTFKAQVDLGIADRADDPEDPVALAPEPPVRDRLVAVLAARNPLLEAAQPLLRALADLPAQLDERGMQVLHRLLEREVATFQSLCTGARVRHEHMVAASYALCTALDEAASSTPWGGALHGEAGAWAARQLAARFHGDTRGGEKFFLLVGRLAADLQEHLALLELMYQILGLGFEGRFGTAARGRRQLDAIRQRLLDLLDTAHGQVPRELSPHGRGGLSGRFRPERHVPVWLTAMLLAMVLVGLFVGYRQRLEAKTMVVRREIAAIGTAPRAGVQPPLRLKALLAEEIARGAVSVEEDERRSAVAFRSDGMFVAGQARIEPAAVPAVAKVADELRRVGGAIVVTGHSDDRPIRTRAVPDNQALSEQRAAAVARLLIERQVDAARIRTEGRAERVPLADNATAAGRARNRRVEIAVTAPAAP